jgi:tripartite-type tricarboxylate transporter receptor subunit TctC
VKLPRREFLHLAAGPAVLPVVSRVARGQTYPSRPVRIVVGFAPGGATDIMARVMAQWLTERLGQPFVIENRTGAGGNIATEAVVHAPSDGYTLLAVTSTATVNTTLYGNLNFDLIRDIAPVAAVHREPHILEVNPSLPVNTVPEFIAYAKARPGKINMGSAGIGSGNHIAGELFKMMAGVDLVHVPYRGGGPALVDLLGGQVQVMFATTSSSIQYVRTGKLRALAVTTATRFEGLPQVPSVSEFVAGYEASFWTGIGAPQNTPVEIVERLNKEINAGFADSGMKARFAELGASALPGTPADFGRLIAEDTEKWGKVVRFSGAKAG